MFKKNTPKSLSEILSSFYTTLDELEDLIERNEELEKSNAQKIEILTQENVSLSAERKRAETVIEKIQSLIS